MRYRLEELFDLQMGKTPARANLDYWNGTNKWVSISDLSGYDKYVTNTKECISDLGVSESGIKVVPKNTVIMSFKLSIGKTAITTEDVYTNEAIMAFIDKGVCEINTDYLYYLFSGTDWNKGTNKAVLGLTLNKATLSKKEIDIPDLHTQNEVVKKLDALSNVIQLQKLSLDKLDELIKSRFVEMFGDWSINPNMYDIEALDKHIDVLSGFPFDSSLYVNDGINICGGLIIMPHHINWDECKHWKTTSGYKDYILCENDIVMALDRPWISEGFKIAKIDKNHLPALLIQRTARIRAIDINQEYLYHCFDNCGFDNHCNITGSLVPHISLKDIKSFKVMIPPINLQNQFADFVTQVEKQKATVQQSIDKLEILKKSLMQEFFG